MAKQPCAPKNGQPLPWLTGILPLSTLLLAACHGDPPTAGDSGAAAQVSPFARASGYDPSWRARPARRLAPSSPTPAVKTVAVKTAVVKTAVAPPPVAPGDPMRGRFALTKATAKMPAGDALVAQLETSAGPLTCQLWPHRAPNTVAHFVGLANGSRPWFDGLSWRTTPAYDGSLFHRIDPDSGIRGGREGNVPADAPGFFIADEPWPGMKHDRAGLLCAVGAGPSRVGMEFLITTQALPRLDRPSSGRAAFTVFGQCTPLSRIRAIAARPASRGRPGNPVVLRQLRVTRP